MRPRSRFAPTVGLGVASAALTSVAAAKPWFRLGTDRPTQGVPPSETVIDMPLALALSLVVLAGWGVVLVARGPRRRLAAAVALAAAIGVVACVAVAPFVLPDDLRDRVGPSVSGIATVPTGWFVTAAVGSVISVIALVLAWRLAPTWPTMGSRYDAPTGPAEPASETDLWKALDEGRDPTAPDDPASS